MGTKTKTKQFLASLGIEVTRIHSSSKHEITVVVDATPQEVKALFTDLYGKPKRGTGNLRGVHSFQFDTGLQGFINIEWDTSLPRSEREIFVSLTQVPIKLVALRDAKPTQLAAAATTLLGTEKPKYTRVMKDLLNHSRMNWYETMMVAHEIAGMGYTHLNVKDRRSITPLKLN